MSKYKIFAGLGGGFNSVQEHCIEEFSSEEQAIDYAYDLACDEYDSYAGLHGLRDWSECREEAKGYSESDDYDDPDQYENDVENYTNQIYNEDRESWIVYYVEKVEE